jgi:hypothetical protein
MKKKMKSILVIGTLLLSLVMFFSCYDHDYSCHEQGQLDCDNGRCCDEDLPWHDGHGTCYEDLSYCRQTGWACVGCH